MLPWEQHQSEDNSPFGWCRLQIPPAPDVEVFVSPLRVTAACYQWTLSTDGRSTLSSHAQKEPAAWTRHTHFTYTHVQIQPGHINIQQDCFFSPCTVPVHKWFIWRCAVLFDVRWSEEQCGREYIMCLYEWDFKHSATLRNRSTGCGLVKISRSLSYFQLVSLF